MKTEKLKIITCWDERDEIKALIKINGKRKIKTISDFKWFFAVTKKDYEKIPSYLLEKYERADIVRDIVKGDNYVKIFADKAYQKRFTLDRFIKELKEEGIEPLESDLTPSKCWLHNNLIEIDGNIDVLYFDIETDDSNQRIEIGRDRILSWAACDSNGKTYFDSGDEKKILKSFVNLIHKYDAFVGWNSKNFDLPYIKARMKHYNLEYNWRKRIHVDLMARLIKLFGGIMGLLNLPGFSLNDVAKTFLQKEKITFKGKIIDLYHNDFEKFKEYNIMDAKLLYDLDKKIMALPLMIKECEWTGTLLNKFYIGEILDNYILREAKRRKEFLTSRPTFTEQEEHLKIKVRGGYVMEPKTGLYENVRVFDFKSLYPSIIVGWNIGHDSLNKELSLEGDKSLKKLLLKEDKKIEDIPFDTIYKFLMKEKKRLDPDDEHYQTANNNFFSREHKSFIGDLVQDLLDQRKVYKKRLDELVLDTAEYRNVRAQQEVVKEMANSMYGITADRRGRYFNLNIAEGITLTGQFLNKALIAFTEKEGYEVIYGDTDSIFFVVDDKEDIDAIVESINKKLKKFLDTKFKLRNNIVFAKYEKNFRKMIMLDKKRYTGNLDWMDGKKIDKIFTRGVETVKKNTIEYTRRRLNELIDMLVRKGKTEKQIKRWLKKVKNEVLNLDIKTEDLVIKTKITKPTHKYKSKPIHVRIAEKLINEGKILQPREGKRSWGESILYIVTQTKPKLDGVHIDEFDGKWDRRYYWDVQVYAPIMRILKAVWPDSNWEEHNILLFEKMKKKEELEKRKKEREKERERKKKLREAKKKSKTTKKKTKKKSKQLTLL